jgi:hypothetical protein
MIRMHIVMKKKIPRKERNIIKEKTKETKINPSRKSSTQENTIPHWMKMMIVTMTQKE